MPLNRYQEIRNSPAFTDVKNIAYVLLFNICLGSKYLFSQVTGDRSQDLALPPECILTHV
jgi:hypothetical protein